MKRRRRPGFIRVAVVLLGIGGLLYWRVMSAHRQRELNITLAGAIQRDDLSSIRKLVDQGADPNTRADLADHRETLIEKFKRMLMRREPSWPLDGETALFRAANHGDLDLIRLLAKRGANVNEKAGPGFTPIFLAAGMESYYNETVGQRSLSGARSLDTCRLLIQLGANPNAANRYDGIPLRYAILNKNDPLISLFLERRPNWMYQDRFTQTCFSDAVDSGNEALVRKWLGEGANANESANRHKISVLMTAVENGDLDIAKMLLKAGADPNAQDDGQIFGTPLIAAVLKGNERMVELLLMFGARPDLAGISPYRKDTPLDSARKLGSRRIISMLQEARKRLRSYSKPSSL